jgi:hypothetical protein
MSKSAAEIASEVARAFNELGHIARGHSLDEARSNQGDDRLKEMLDESARLCLDFIQSVEQGSTTFARPAEAKAALSRFQSLLSNLELDDKQALGELRACAHQVFECLGLPLPE